MTLKDKVIIYLYRKLNDCEEDYNEELYLLRYQKPDEVNFMETLIKKSRKDLMREVCNDIMAILGMTDREQFFNLMKK